MLRGRGLWVVVWCSMHKSFCTCLERLANYDVSTQLTLPCRAVTQWNKRPPALPLSSGRSVEAKKRKRIGESEEPYGIPVSVGRVWGSRHSPRMSFVDRLVRKDWTNATSQPGMPFARRL